MIKTIEAAKVILETLWFAKNCISDNTIDFKKIDDKFTSISPSTTEIFRYKLAKDIFYEEGFISGLNSLDQNNRKAIFEAFKILLG